MVAPWVKILQWSRNLSAAETTKPICVVWVIAFDASMEPKPSTAETRNETENQTDDRVPSMEPRPFIREDNKDTSIAVNSLSHAEAL